MVLSQRRTVLMLGLFGLLWSGNPTAAQKGKTIFGDSQVETIKAMKKIVKAIGVKRCTHCHVKEGGKPKFDLETPNKKVARRMKIGFVDSLVAKGRVELAFPESEHKTQVVAVYTASGENPGIHLTATTGTALKEGEKLDDGMTPKSYSRTVALPKKDEAVTCMTCHNRKLHFLTEAEE